MYAASQRQIKPPFGEFPPFQSINFPRGHAPLAIQNAGTKNGLQLASAFDFTPDSSGRP